MLNADQTIPCPACETKIPFDAKQLLSGAKFECPSNSCDATISIAPEAKPIVHETLDQLEEIKKNIIKH